MDYANELRTDMIISFSLSSMKKEKIDGGTRAILAQTKEIGEVTPEIKIEIERKLIKGGEYITPETERTLRGLLGFIGDNDFLKDKKQNKETPKICEACE